MVDFRYNTLHVIPSCILFLTSCTPQKTKQSKQTKMPFITPPFPCSPPFYLSVLVYNNIYHRNCTFSISNQDKNLFIYFWQKLNIFIKIWLLSVKQKSKIMDVTTFDTNPHPKTFYAFSPMNGFTECIRAHAFYLPLL